MIPHAGGDLTADPGDWIITEADGSRHPVKPDIFEKSWEQIE